VVSNTYYIKLFMIYSIFIIGLLTIDIFLITLSYILGYVIAYREFSEDNNYITKCLLWTFYLLKRR